MVAILNSANSLRNRGEFDDAYEKFEEVVRKDENNPEGYWGLFLSEYGIMHVQDPVSKKYIPTCNRASGIPTSEDKNFKKALELSNELQRGDYITKAVQLEEIRQKIIDISKSETPYDIFICYKRTQTNENGKESYTEDAINARDIYDILTHKGYKVFFAEKTLQNLAGAEYEPIIFNALNTSKVMLIICSDPAYINAPWVKNEWRRFIKQIEFDETKKIIPVMCGGLKAGSLPDILNKFQGIEMNVNFQTSLLNSVSKLIDNSRKNSISRVAIAEKRNIRKSNIVKGSIEIRKVGDGGSSLIVSDEKMLKVAFSYVLKNMNKDATREFKHLSANPNLTKICDFALTYLQFRNKPNIDILDKFNECISSVNDVVAGYIFECVVKDFEERLESKDLNRAIALYSALMGWDNPNNEKVFKIADGYIREFPNNKSIKMAEAVAKCYNNQDVDGYINLMKDYAQVYLDNQSTYEGEIILKKIIDVDEGDIDSRWGAFLASFGAINDESIKYCAKYIDGKHITEFKELLAYVEENSRNKCINSLARGVAEGIAFAKSEKKVTTAKYVNYVANSLIKGSNFNIDKKLNKVEKSTNEIPALKKVILDLQKTSVNIHSPFKKDSKVLEDIKYNVFINSFDEIIKFYSQESTEDLIISLYKMADECKYVRQFELATKYYNLIINERNTEHKAYWGLLQCKLKCTSNSELIETHHRLSNFAEYNNAIQAAGVVEESAIDGYLNVKQAQDAQKTKNKLKALKKKVQMGLACGFLGAVALSSVIGSIWYFTPVVTFLNYDGSKVCEVKVDKGGKATPDDMSKFTRPDDYYATDYKFVGWSKSVDNITHRTSVKAVFVGTPVYYNLTIKCGEYGHLTYRIEGKESVTLKSGESIDVQLTYGQYIKFDVTPDEGFVCDNWKFEQNNGGYLTEVQKPSNADGDFLYAMTHNDMVISPHFQLEGYTAISTAEELDNIRNNLSGKYYLANDIDLATYSNWQPINNFTGSFHGLNHTIFNLTINSIQSGNNGYVGLFGDARDASFRNVKLKNVNINIDGEVWNVAGLVSLLYGDDAIIRDIEVSGVINAPNATRVAGIVGYLELGNGKSDIYNLTNNAVVNGKQSVGGIFGKINFRNSDCSVEMYNCQNTGSITGSEEVGGIFGCGDKVNKGDRLTFRNLTNTGTIKGTNSFVGGIVGRSYRINMTLCTNNSQVSGGYIVGAIAGKAEYATMSFLYNENSVVIGTGQTSEGDADLGGMIGWLCSGEINNCTNKAQISYTGSGCKIGGLVGEATIDSDTSLMCLGNDVDVYMPNYKYVGGLFGYVSSECWLALTDCSVMGKVTGKSDVGILIGYSKSKRQWSLVGEWNANYKFYSITINKENQGMKLVTGQYTNEQTNEITYVEI